MKKRTLTGGMLGVALLFTAANARAQFPDEVRQALRGAAGEAAASLRKAGAAPRNRTISILPLAGDRDAYVEGLLKSAFTAQGLSYVEGKSDPMWEKILEETER